MRKITTFLMFEGKAEEAMNFYISLFEDSEIKSISRYGENEAGPVGSTRHAVFTINGQELMCIDSFVSHGFSFTPAMSLFVSLDNESELDKIYAALAEGGQILMPLAAYPFSKKYGWVNDRFGVSWQLTLADA